MDIGKREKLQYPSYQELVEEEDIEKDKKSIGFLEKAGDFCRAVFNAIGEFLDAVAEFVKGLFTSKEKEAQDKDAAPAAGSPNEKEMSSLLDNVSALKDIKETQGKGEQEKTTSMAERIENERAKVQQEGGIVR